MTVEATILKELKHIKEQIATLRQQQKKEERWVSAYWIMQITGWDTDTLKTARRQNIIIWRTKGARGVEYLLSSVPEEFKKKTA